jgi:hypothetical protein
VSKSITLYWLTFCVEIYSCSRACILDNAFCSVKFESIPTQKIAFGWFTRHPRCIMQIKRFYRWCISRTQGCLSDECMHVKEKCTCTPSLLPLKTYARAESKGRINFNFPSALLCLHANIFNNKILFPSR